MQKELSKMYVIQEKILDKLDVDKSKMDNVKWLMANGNPSHPAGGHPLGETINHQPFLSGYSPLARADVIKINMKLK